MAWALWVAGLAVASYPALLSGFESVQVYAGDPRLVGYILEHSWRWLVGEELNASFWSPPAFYPQEGVGGYSDTLVGAAPFYWVWRWAGIGPGVALQLWMMVALSLDYWAAHLFLSRCVRVPAVPAALGAFLFGFASVRLANFNSPQLFPLFYATFALFALHRALAGGRRAGGWILVFFAALAAQAWSAFYAAFFAVLVLALAAGSGLALAEPRRRIVALVRRHGAATGLGAAGAVLAVLPLARAHAGAAGEVGWRGVETIVSCLPTWRSWVFLGESNLLYGGLASLEGFTFPVHPSQHSNGTGVVTGLVALWGLVESRRRPLAALVLVTGAFAALLVTRLPNGFSVWRTVVDWIPGARAVRYMARIGMFLPFATAVGVALFLARRAGRPSLVWALVLACAAEQVHRAEAVDDSQYWRSVALVAGEVDRDAEAFVVQPVTGPRNRAQPRVVNLVAMWAALEVGVPTVNGFYGKQPKRWGLKTRNVAEWLALHGIDPERVDWVDAPAEWFQLRE